jgi:hypothetical protein
MKHPTAHAKELADAILGDRIAAGQIKEYISNDQLFDILGIEFPDLPEPEEDDITDWTSNEMLCELKRRGITLATIEAYYKK